MWIRTGPLDDRVKVGDRRAGAQPRAVTSCRGLIPDAGTKRYFSKDCRSVSAASTLSGLLVHAGYAMLTNRRFFTAGRFFVAGLASSRATFWAIVWPG